MKLEGNQLGTTGHEPNFIEKFVKNYIQPLCKKEITPVSLSVNDHIQVLFGSGLIPLFPAQTGAKYADFKEQFGKDLNVHFKN